MPGAFFCLIPLLSAPISCRRETGLAEKGPICPRLRKAVLDCRIRLWNPQEPSCFLGEGPGRLMEALRRKQEEAGMGGARIWGVQSILKLGAWHGFKNEMGFVPEFFFFGNEIPACGFAKRRYLPLGGGILTFAAPKKFKSRPLRGMCLAAALMRGYFPGFSGLAPRERHMGHMVSRVLQRCARQCSRP